MKYWRVSTPAGSTIYVKADYVRQQEGCLMFRNDANNSPQRYGWRDTYPDLVRMIAPGFWCGVRQMTEHEFNMAHGEKPALPLRDKAKPVRKVTRKRRG